MDGGVDEALAVGGHAVAGGEGEGLLQAVDETEEVEGGDAVADGLVLEVDLLPAGAFLMGSAEEAAAERGLGAGLAVREDPDTEWRQHVGSKRKRTTGQGGPFLISTLYL